MSTVLGGHAPRSFQGVSPPQPTDAYRRLAIRPSQFMMKLLLAVTLASLLFSWGMERFGLPPLLWIVAVAALLLILFADGWVARRQRSMWQEKLLVERGMPHAFALGVRREIGLTISNACDRRVSLMLWDFTPAGLQAEGMPQSFVVEAGEIVRASYWVKPVQRGQALFGRLEALVDSRLGFWQARVWLGKDEAVRVYPNFAAVAKFALLATDHRLSRLGVKLKRRRGEGMEFHQLREYRQGDSLRQIDWKATTRQRKLISREYQDERDQRLVFLLDCSRRMRAQDGDLSHFDQALNSLMLLTHVALKQGDSVGALSFGGVERFYAPGKGETTLNAITNALYDIEPQSRTGDYLAAAERLMREVPKRSMVVILTNLRDEDEDELGLAIRVLSAKHLVVVASLREEILGEMMQTEVTNLDQAVSVSAAHLYLEQRRRTFARLIGRETFAIDVEPRQLPIALVNQYLEIKRSGRL